MKYKRFNLIEKTSPWDSIDDNSSVSYKYNLSNYCVKYR